MGVYLLITGVVFVVYGSMDFISGNLKGDEKNQKIGTMSVIIGLLCINQADDFLSKKINDTEQTERATNEQGENHDGGLKEK